MMRLLKKLLSFNGKKLNITTALLTCVLSSFLLLVSLVTFAWFAHNKETTANGININPHFEDTVCEYVIYKYNINKGYATTKDANEVPYQLGTNSPINMNKYDLIFTDLNAFTPLVLRIQIETTAIDTQVNGSFNVLLKRNPLTDVLFNNEGKTSNTLTSEIEENGEMIEVAYCSSLLSFIPGINNSWYVDNNENLTYNNVVSNLRTHESLKFTSFTTTEQGGNTTYTYTKTDNINLNVNYTPSDWGTKVVDGKTVSVLQLFILIDYDKGQYDTNTNKYLNNGLLSTFVSNQVITSLESLDSKILNDLTMIEINNGV